MINIPFKNLDYLGAVLVLAGTVLPVFIINQAAIRDYAWDNIVTVEVFVVAGTCWIVLFFWERDLSKKPRFSHIRPQLPFRILSSRVMMAATL